MLRIPKFFGNNGELKCSCKAVSIILTKMLASTINNSSRTKQFVLVKLKRALSSSIQKKKVECKMTVMFLGLQDFYFYRVKTT